MTQNGRLLATVSSTDQQKGDFQAQEPHNVNVILQQVIKKLNVNVGEVARFLCQVFGESPKKQGYYINLYNKQGCQNADTWMAAVVETLQAAARHRSDVLGNPGGYFYKRCVALHREGVSPQTLQLAQQYGALTYQQILDGFRQSKTMAAPQSEAGSAAAPVSVPSLVSFVPFTPPLSGKKAPTLPPPPPLLIADRDRTRPGMSEQDYQQLKMVILRNKFTCQGRIVPKRQLDGSLVALFDDGMKHQVWLCSVAEVEQRMQHMHNTRDFFSQGDDIKNSTSGNYKKEGK
jgi:hypothetical protein